MSHAASERLPLAATSRGRAAKAGKANAPAAAADTPTPPSAIGSYFRDSRNAIYSFCLALPFVLIYEIGVYKSHHHMLNGGDWLLRALMNLFSPEHVPFASLGVLAMVFLAYQFIRNDSLKVRPAVLFGLSVESFLYAVILIPLAAWSVAYLQHLGQPATPVTQFAPANTPQAYIAQASQLSAAVHPAEPADRWTDIVLFCGAGVYEELVFRVLALWSLFGIGKLLKLAKWVNVLQAAVGSALIFSLFHYYPPGPYPFDWATFTYRALAGLYFTTIVYTRNFGVAVASHAMYDIMVG